MALHLSSGLLLACHHAALHGNATQRKEIALGDNKPEIELPQG